MPYIQLCYGPYESNGIIKHRPQKLHGLIKYLTLKDYEVEVTQTEHLDRLTVEICDTTVFRCNVTNLLFGMDAEDDVVCLKAIAMIEEAIERLYSEKNAPKFVSMKKGMRFARMGDRSAADYLGSDITLLYEIERKRKNYSDEVSLDLSAESKNSKNSKNSKTSDRSDSWGMSMYNFNKKSEYYLDKSHDVDTVHTSESFSPTKAPKHPPPKAIAQESFSFTPSDSQGTNTSSLRAKTDKHMVFRDKVTIERGSSAYLVNTAWMKKSEYDSSDPTKGVRPTVQADADNDDDLISFLSSRSTDDRQRRTALDATKSASQIFENYF